MEVTWETVELGSTPPPPRQLQMQILPLCWVLFWIFFNDLERDALTKRRVKKAARCVSGGAVGGRLCERSHG